MRVSALVGSQKLKVTRFETRDITHALGAFGGGWGTGWGEEECGF